MSLVATALRIITTKALLGMTAAEERVWDSAMTPLDLKIETEKAPLILVYTDSESADSSGTNLLDTDRELALTLQFAVASRVTELRDNVVLEYPHTDPVMEAVLDLMVYDAKLALQVGQDPWQDLWRNFVVQVTRQSVQRGHGHDKGMRFAARELTLVVSPIYDPYSIDLTVHSAWRRLIELMQEDPDLGSLARAFESRLGVGRGEEPWRDIKHRLGLSAAELWAVGQGPLYPSLDVTPPLEQVDAAPAMEQVDLGYDLDPAIAT